MAEQFQFQQSIVVVISCYETLDSLVSVAVMWQAPIIIKCQRKDLTLSRHYWKSTNSPNTITFRTGLPNISLHLQFFTPYIVRSHLCYCIVPVCLLYGMYCGWMVRP